MFNTAPNRCFTCYAVEEDDQPRVIVEDVFAATPEAALAVFRAAMRQYGLDEAEIDGAILEEAA